MLRYCCITSFQTSPKTLSGTDIEFPDLSFKIDAGGLRACRRRLRSSATMLLPFLFLLDSRPTPSDRLRLTGSSLLPPVFDETLTVFRRVLSSIKSGTYSSATASSTILASTTAPSASLVVTATPATILATTPSSQADARSRSVQSVRIQTAAPVTHPKSTQPQPLQHRIKLIQIVSGREVYSLPLQPYCSTSSTARTTILSCMFVASHNLFTTVRYLPEFSSSPSRRRYPYFLVIFKSRDLIRKTNALSPMGLAHFMAVESLSRPFIRLLDHLLCSSMSNQVMLDFGSWRCDRPWC
ncbi:hypothetical protein YC2023_015847 [Brassica napus]